MWQFDKITLNNLKVIGPVHEILGQPLYFGKSDNYSVSVILQNYLKHVKRTRINMSVHITCFIFTNSFNDILISRYSVKVLTCVHHFTDESGHEFVCFCSL